MIKYQKFILSKLFYLGISEGGPTGNIEGSEPKIDFKTPEEQERLDFEAKRDEAIKEISAIASLLPEQKDLVSKEIRELASLEYSPNSSSIEENKFYALRKIFYDVLPLSVISDGNREYHEYEYDEIKPTLVRDQFCEHDISNPFIKIMLDRKDSERVITRFAKEMTKFGIPKYSAMIQEERDSRSADDLSFE